MLAGRSNAPSLLEHVCVHALVQSVAAVKTVSTDSSSPSVAQSFSPQDFRGVSGVGNAGLGRPRPSLAAAKKLAMAG